ncbi:MAG: hypothetical protein JHC31_16150, partial [Sulfurihydrogenibium sp.]|nr:hypothetical protein [Sulfurihydrogenibium sp.]
MQSKGVIRVIGVLRKQLPSFSLTHLFTFSLLLLICLALIYKHKDLDKKVQRLEKDITLLISASDPQTKNLLEKRMREIRFKSNREKVDAMEDIIPSKADL